MVIFRRKIAGLSASTLERFALRARRAVRLCHPVNVLVTSNQELRSLNRRFRGKDQATDVLSFPSKAPGIAGDIAISLEIAAANAADIGHSLATEVKVLILHGMLHLAGYDHEADSGEMLARETAMRQELKLPIGLIERTHLAAAKAADLAREPKPGPKKAAAARSATAHKRPGWSQSKPGVAKKPAARNAGKRGEPRA